jgi:spore coat protein U-like protein
MMSLYRWTRRVPFTLALLGLAVLTAKPVEAQSTATASIAAIASVVGVAPLTATGVNDLNFGSVPAGSPTTPASLASQAGRFDITGEPAAPVSVTFTLPTDLTGAGGTIPITFGTTDGLEWAPFPTAFTTFDPTVPYLTAIDGTGNLTIGISGTVNPPSGTTTGTYTGTITLTVAY